MSLWAIVPVKPLRRGKSRLAGVLSEEERTQLNFFLLSHTLSVLAGVSGIKSILVVSRDSAALALARDHRAKTVQEDGRPHLNTALRRATAIAQAYSTEGVLILPADLPLLQPSDVEGLIALAKDPPVMVISPDRRQEGTNALLVSPAGVIDYAFGPESFQKHCSRAAKSNIRLEIYENPAISLDLDLPEDLEMLRQMEDFNLDLEPEYRVKPG